jgi:hypothetical protein
MMIEKLGTGPRETAVRGLGTTNRLVSQTFTVSSLSG